jgi:hypothetical protein
MTSSQSSFGKVPIHVGLFEPGTPRAEVESRHDPRRPTPLQQRSPLSADSGIDWTALGIEPRWVYMETSDCAAALEPNAFHNRGAEEVKRFFAGTRSRQELALLLSAIGDPSDDTLPSPLASHDSSLLLPVEFSASIGGRRLPSGTRVRLADGVSLIDKDLGLRLLNQNPPTWWALDISAIQFGSGTSLPLDRAQQAPPGIAGIGALQPILVDGLGAPVVAVWVDPESSLRWYFIPGTSDWATVVDWLTRQALPAYVPEALRRARPTSFVDPDLETDAEQQARRQLAALELQYATDKQALQEELRQASECAEAVREGLLYGTGQQTVTAVARLLADAGFDVTDLDEDLAATKSADLLARLGPDARLIEVKSPSGNAKEELVGDLQRHLNTWPALKPDQPIGGGVLVVNHQRKKPPHQREPEVYKRPEFVATLPFPVLSAKQLFEWWRAADWKAIRTAILGVDPQHTGPPPTPAATRRPDRRKWFGHDTNDSAR